MHWNRSVLWNSGTVSPWCAKIYLHGETTTPSDARETAEKTATASTSRWLLTLIIYSDIWIFIRTFGFLFKHWIPITKICILKNSIPKQTKYSTFILFGFCSNLYWKKKNMQCIKTIQIDYLVCSFVCMVSRGIFHDYHIKTDHTFHLGFIFACLNELHLIHLVLLWAYHQLVTRS